MNSAGRDAARPGCSQRSRASTPTSSPVASVDDGLVVADELPAPSGPRGSRPRCAAGSCARWRSSSSKRTTVPRPAGLGGVHRGVGVAEQVGRATCPGSPERPRPTLAPGSIVPPRQARARRGRASRGARERLGAALVGDALARGRRTRRRRSGPRCPRAGRSASGGAATCRSSSSPAAWPRLSLTSLKWSRSRKQHRHRLALGAAAARACSSASSSRARFGSPVSASWNAWWASWTAVRFWSEVSTSCATTYCGSPSGSRSTTAVCSVHTTPPSARR